MDKCSLKSSALILYYVCRIYFPKYPPYYFPIYMIFVYNHIRKRKKLFKIVSHPYEAIEKLAHANTTPPFTDDINNSVIISQNYLTQSVTENFVKIANKPAYLISADIPADIILISDCLNFNIKSEPTTKLDFINSNRIPLANEIDLSIISTCYDLSNGFIDSLIKNYFRTLKIVCVNDLISINFKKYAPEFYYTNTKHIGLKFIYLKCNKLYIKEELNEYGFCILGETVIKQSANIQSFIAPIFKHFIPFNFENCSYDQWLIDECPYGLQTYVDKLTIAVKPFLKTNAIKLRPTFLLQGNKGSGKSTIVSTIASVLGLHLYTITSGDISATVYVQNEIKLGNVFLKAKFCAPCILFIKDFENLTKNNDGVHDERLLSYFESHLDEVFVNNTFPIILICSSNSKEIPPGLSRLFLEVFEINTPNTNQRLQNLDWIISYQNVNSNAKLEDVAEKTHSFLFEDLQALSFYAQRNCLQNNRTILEQVDFDLALDTMQANYSQSLGAPKIPKVQWSDVGGLSDVKHEIIRTINLPLQHPELLRSSGLKRSGILLYGPPGTGKTLIAKAVATECNLCFLSVKGPELLNMYVGQSEQNVREVFEKARDAAPCIIFFDELDSLAPNRGISGDSGGVMDRVVSQLLAEMDGLNQSATIFIIGATNRPDLIDPALLRPGRFDKLLYVGPCTDIESKISVLKALTRKFNLDRDVSLEQVVNLCPKNITGADFYGLCSLAWTSCVRRLIETDEDNLESLSTDDVIVTFDDFKTALNDLKPSISGEDLLYFEKLQKEYATNIVKKV